MKLKFLAVAILLALIQAAHAQTLRGTVSETGTRNKMSDVFVKNINNKQISLTDKNGSFTIPAQVGNLIVFSSPGFTSDTLYVVDMKPKDIQLATQSISLREVNITASRTFNPRAEYPEVYERSKVYALSPTTWFSQEGHRARRLKHYFEREAQERRIDSAFSRAYVSSIIPLRGQELDDFLMLYRPSYAFLRSNTAESMAVYINDCYKKYMALPPDKRKLQRLNP